MAAPTTAEQIAIIFQRLQIATTSSVVSDVFTDAQMLVALNEAYADLWEVEGGGFTRSNSATLWVASPTSGTTGVNVSLLANIRDIVQLFASSTVGSTGDVTTGDTIIEGPVDISRINFHRANATSFGSYNRPVLYSVTRTQTATAADVGKFQLDVWPGVTAIYLPAWYIKQFTLLTSASTDVMDLTDVGGRDAALLTAARLAPLAGRPELAAGLVADISLRTQEAMKLKERTQKGGDQDR